MFGKWFKKEEPKARRLTRPNDLLKGDMIQMIDSFSLPPQLKNETLTVKDINTYQYEYENEFEFVLQNSAGDILFMTISHEDGEQWANFSVKIKRDQVEELFSLDQFALIFDSEELVSITREGMIDGFERWLDDQYVQAAAPSVGYFYQGDYRQKEIPKYVEDGGEQMEYIGLDSPDEEHSINIEIWRDGETDVSLTLSRPLSDIKDLYPGQS